MEPGSHQDFTQGVDIASERDPPPQGGLQHRGTPAHEGVVDRLSGASQPLNEETGQLGFVAGPVGDLVQGMSRPLFGCPEFVDVDRQLECGIGKIQPNGFPAEIPEGLDASDKIFRAQISPRRNLSWNSLIRRGRACRRS